MRLLFTLLLRIILQINTETWRQRKNSTRRLDYSTMNSLIQRQIFSVSQSKAEKFWTYVQSAGTRSYRILIISNNRAFQNVEFKTMGISNKGKKLPPVRTERCKTCSWTWLRSRKLFSVFTILSIWVFQKACIVQITHCWTGRLEVRSEDFRQFLMLPFCSEHNLLTKIITVFRRLARVVGKTSGMK